MESIFYEKCSLKYEVKAIVDSIFLASRGNSLFIFPAANAKDFWPIITSGVAVPKCYCYSSEFFML